MAPARKGDFLVIVRCRGELQGARDRVQIAAPVNVPQLRIVWQAPPGGAVKEGDPVIRFDPSSAQQQLQEKDAALKQAQATLDQALANARITAEQDKRDSQHAQIRRREGRAGGLQSGDRERSCKAKRAASTWAWPSRSCASRRPPSNLHDASDKAKIASLTRLRDQAQADVDLTKQRLAQMELKAPAQRRRHVHHQLFAGMDERQAVQGGRPGVARRRAWPRFPT